MHSVEPGLFGAVQGLAEFLPISSSGHLLLLHSVTHFSVGKDLTFDVALHVGTLLALIAYFWRDLLRLFLAWVASFRHWNVRENTDQRLAWLLIAASVPGAVAGVLLEQTAETTFRSPVLVGIVIIVAGIGLWAADRYSKQERDMSHLNWRSALAIGLAQAVALVPGISRSGATITVGRLLRLTRSAAARFSFLMSAPILAGAGIKQLLSLRHETLTNVQRTDFLIGMVVAAVVGYLAIGLLLRYIAKHSYSVFMWYRIAIGVTTLLVVWFNR